MKAETPIPDHSAREIERLQMCQMIPDMQWALPLERYLVSGVTGYGRPSTARTTRSLHVNRLCLVQIAVDEWTVAGWSIVVSMPCVVKSVLRDVNVELLLNHNGSRNYGDVKLEYFYRGVSTAPHYLACSSSAQATDSLMKL